MEKWVRDKQWYSRSMLLSSIALKQSRPNVVAYTSSSDLFCPQICKAGRVWQGKFTSLPYGVSAGKAQWGWMGTSRWLGTQERKQTREFSPITSGLHPETAWVSLRFGRWVLRVSVQEDKREIGSLKLSAPNFIDSPFHRYCSKQLQSQSRIKGRGY